MFKLQAQAGKTNFILYNTNEFERKLFIKEFGKSLKIQWHFKRLCESYAHTINQEYIKSYNETNFKLVLRYATKLEVELCIRNSQSKVLFEYALIVKPMDFGQSGSLKNNQL